MPKGGGYLFRVPGPFTEESAEICDCPVPLTMWWNYPALWPHHWVKYRDLTDQSPAAGAEDARRYNQDKAATGWIIRCDECDRVYIKGV